MLARVTRSIRQVLDTIQARDTAASTPRPAAQTPASLLGEAPITISLAQFDGMRGELQRAREQVADLERQLVDARSADPQGRIGELRLLVRSLLVIVRYAFANLPPSENPKWPAKAIEDVVARLPFMPDFNEDDRVLQQEMRFFVKDIEEHEIDRARKRQALVNADLILKR